MSGVVFWLADNVPVWRPFAQVLLAALVLGLLFYFFAYYEETR